MPEEGTIKSVTVNITSESIKKSEAVADKEIGSVSVNGGTEPYTYKLIGTDADKFRVEENKIKIKENLTEAKTYTAKIKVTDKNDKEKESNDFSLMVQENDIVEVNIPSDETAIIGTNKTVKDIQTGIQIDEDKVTGTSNYLEDITGAGGKGNYLVLELPQAKTTGNKVTCSFESGKTTTLSKTDYQYLIKLNNKKPVTITISGKENATRTLDISEIVLSSKD